ncbi:MAG: sensor histidine kinase [Methylotenera sp.]|nr:sensor histidine kinase [Methylotenera sp.]
MRLFNQSNANQSTAWQSALPLQTRAINVLNIFRFILSLTLIGLYFFFSKESLSGIDTNSLFLNLAIAYFVFSFSALLISPLKSISHRYVLPLQVVFDIIFITLLMYAAGGIQSGLGLLLIIIIVTASLISNGRLALFYAAVASICLLLEQSYQNMIGNLSATTYTQPVMLSLSCFATALLAYSLAERMQHSESLASSRGIDIENLSQINALIAQEMQDGVIVVDEQLNIRHHNLQAESLLSFNKNSTAENIALNSNAPEISAKFNAWVKDENVSDDSIVNIGNRDLKLRFMAINHLRKMGAVIFIQDLSQLQSKAQQAKLAALGRLTANIAHEIRNPLSAISHANQLLQEEENISAPTARILQIIEDNIGRIDQIIKDVLELNRRDRTHQEKIELTPFLADFYTQFCAVEKVPSSHFQLLPCSTKHVITFDQRHLMQILWNLCKNGWEHSQKQVGSLTLNCADVGKIALNIQITDDGGGVAETDRARLFEPFFTTKTTGNGLGLYISRELAEANNASLQYQALAHGSTFVISLKKVS